MRFFRWLADAINWFADALADAGDDIVEGQPHECPDLRCATCGAPLHRDAFSGLPAICPRNLA